MRRQVWSQRGRNDRRHLTHYRAIYTITVINQNTEYFFPMVIKLFECVWTRPSGSVLHVCVAIISVSTLHLHHIVVVTCSGLSPGGTHEYSSEAQPESSSEMECLWKSDTSFVIIFSSWPGTERTTCSSRTHLQCTQIFLWRQGQLQASSSGTLRWFTTEAKEDHMSNTSGNIHRLFSWWFRFRGCKPQNKNLNPISDLLLYSLCSDKNVR